MRARTETGGRIATLAAVGWAGWALAVAPAVPQEGEPWFREVAAESGLEFTHFNGMVGELYFVEMMGAGVGVLDFDGDGDLDVLAVQGSPLAPEADAVPTFPPAHPEPYAHRLFRNDLGFDAAGRRVARFTDVTAQAGLGAGDYGMTVATGDLDNDGDVDVYFGSFGRNRLLRNRGDGTFEDVTATSGSNDLRWTTATSVFDFDRDGWLDLFTGNYVYYEVGDTTECALPSGAVDYCGPWVYRPQGNGLFRNLGDGTFEDVSARARVASPEAATLGSVVSDIDGDGWLDLYVANDGSPNQLLMNQRDGSFVDDALLAGAAVNDAGMPEGSMGVVAGDIDGDGHEDLFMTHLEEETNTLYLGDGAGVFRDGTRGSGLGVRSRPYTGFGTVLLDADRDGALDLFVTNGAVKRSEAQLMAGEPHPLAQPDQLYRNTGGGAFEDVTDRAGAFRWMETGRGVARADIDNDGDDDLLTTSNAGPLRLYRNELPGGESWLSVRVVTRPGGRDVLGAEVELVAGPSRQRRRVATDGSYLSASDPRVSFEAAPGRSLRVRCVGEGERVWTDPPMGRILTVACGGLGG